MNRKESQMMEVARALDVLADQSQEQADLCPDPLEHGYSIGKAAGYRYAAQMIRTILP